MGEYLTPKDLRKRFADPLQGLAEGFSELCDAWQEAHDSRAIIRPDLLLNTATPETALGTLKKLLREASGKLEDAIAGVYRYRDAERGQTRRRKGDKRPK